MTSDRGAVDDKGAPVHDSSQIRIGAPEDPPWQSGSFDRIILDHIVKSSIIYDNIVTSSIIYDHIVKYSIGYDFI